MNKLCCCLLALLIGAVSLSSQTIPDSVYQISRKTDVPVLVASAGLNAVSFLSIRNLGSRSEADLAGLSMEHLIGLDKKAIDNHSAFAADASNWTAGGSMLLPLTLMADKNIRDEAAKISVLLSETVLITNGLTLATKRIVLRDRPYVFNPGVSLEEKLSVESRLSFFSGHTSMSAAMSFFTAKVWSDYHPDSKWKPVVWTAAATVPAITGYLRFKAGKHYFTDVAAGYAVGALVGYFVPHFHKVDRSARRKFRVSSTMVNGAPVFVFRCRL
ncbi:MAG: phosphatase PAP2 family protein [Bacteroidetes bacterium]|nr:phosphatase PAP2 family protein [Bacteroidota bacterium]